MAVYWRVVRRASGVADTIVIDQQGGSATNASDFIIDDPPDNASYIYVLQGWTNDAGGVNRRTLVATVLKR